MAFGVFVAGAECVDDVVVVVGHVPDAIWSFEFIALVGLGLESLGLLGQLGAAGVTLSMSADRDLLELYFTMLFILTEVEYRAYIRPLIFI